MHLVLTGMMGAGKTTVGRECAARLDRPFVDTDDLVEVLAHSPVNEIFERDGEDRFRSWERQAVADVCGSPEPLVVACGGGAVLDPATRLRLREAGLVVWLQAPAPVLHERVGGGEGRPLLSGAPSEALDRLLLQRADAYEAAAHVAVDTDGRDVEAVVEAVLALFDECGEPV